jgi:hydroxyacylglutathione hydrolase
MQNLEIHMFICRSDNFGILLHDPESGATASIDTPDPDTISDELAARGWELSHIFNTHHHYDHADGNIPLKRQTGCTIVGCREDAHRIPGIDVRLSDGDTYDFAGCEVKVIATPGHTDGHICYWLPTEEIVFTGDALFSMGCGRLFEGTPTQMWHSLQKLAKLPPQTMIYCGHEYTIHNLQFALEMEPDNPKLQKRAEEVMQLLSNGKFTLPVSIRTELDTNPFLRPNSPLIQQTLGMENQPPEPIIAEIRQRRNNI